MKSRNTKSVMGSAKRIAVCVMMLVVAATMSAQRFTDKLDRGLVAVPSDGGNFVSWKIFGEEYYNTTYNLYANGRLVKGGLKVSCYSHSGGNSSTKYQVAAVINGVEQERCAEVRRWENGYKDIPLAAVVDRNGQTVTSDYILNDISLGDVTGNGVTEFIVKRNYTGDILNASNKTRFHHYECYTLDGERLWWIDLGPNLMSGPDEQWDLVAYDWDEDGKAECVMRGANNMIIHTATGHDIQIGNINYYAPRDEYTKEGDEFLLYLNGATGEPYGWDGQTDKFTPMAYPLPRFENGESDYAAVWGAWDTGHRSCKHYFGAPVLDGKHASIFLGRGCYTRHKMCALDVDPSTHELTQRWRWDGTDWPWFGQGFHNFAIGDVDWDGRDEIIFGSMIIDDNGQGLCTTGLGHGDAQHCADLDPYRHGSEQFTCNETSPACTYYNATTGKYYYRLQTGGDDGRALAGNFSNAIPGSIGRSTQSGCISLTADKVITSGAPATGGTNDALYWSHLNQRIYWDGDLCDEVMDSPGAGGREAVIYKPGGGRLLYTDRCGTNNSSKNNPCAIADIFGDWREELIMRGWDNNIRIWTTGIPTTYRIPTLWHDHQYRNAMVWQCVGYNQPPHKSYFLGEMEGIIVAPPPYTNTGRVNVPDGSAINSSHNGQTVLVYDTQDISVSVSEGANPAVAIFNVPSWVQGTNSNIINGIAATNTVYYTCTVTGEAFGTATRIVKQGDGILTLPSVEQPTTAPTDIWAGTLNFNGKLLNSSLWLNRFAELNSDGGEFRRIKADYAAIVRPGGTDNRGTIKTDSLMLGFGSRTVFDIYADGIASDCITTRLLNIETKLSGNWVTYGPQYLTPVIELVNHGDEIADGQYLLFDGVEMLKGKLTDIIIEGLGTSKKCMLQQDSDKVYLVISSMRAASDIVWTGAASAEWQLGGEENFRLTVSEGTPECFVTGDVVRFTDEATKTTVSLKGEIDADSVIVDASKNYTFKGMGAIIGETTLVKRGTGNLTIQNDNTYTGGTRISGGKLTVSTISNENQAYGNLGGVTTVANKFIIENGATLAITTGITQGSPMQILGTEGGVLECNGDFVMNKTISGTTLVKRGTAWMHMHNACSLQRLIIEGGGVQCHNANKVASTVEFHSGTYNENTGSSFTLYVPEGKTGTWNTANRASYTNKVTGEGTLTIYCEEEKGNNYMATRTQLCLDFSTFEGTIKATGRGDDPGARWTLNTNKGLAKGTLDIADGLTVLNTGQTFAIGRVSGNKGKLGGYAYFSNSGGGGVNTWQIGNDDDWTWGGIVTDNSNLIKAGIGCVTLKGASNHTGSTSINAGELKITSTTSLGTGALTVKKGGILSGVTGTGKLTNSKYTFNTGSTLQVGATATSTSGTINFGEKNVTIARNATLIIGVSGAATASTSGCTSLTGINRLTMNGTIQLHYSASFAPEVGDSVVLWKATSLSGTPVLENDTIDAEKGLFWDTTDLNSGILRVIYKDPTAIRNILTDENSDAVYDLNGRKVADALTAHQRKGIYIYRGKKIVVK